MDIAANKLIMEIDVSKQASALRFLRFTDYTLVLLCSVFLMAMFIQLIEQITSLVTHPAPEPSKQDSILRVAHLLNCRRNRLLF